MPLPLDSRDLGSTTAMGSAISENWRIRFFLHSLDRVAIFPIREKADEKPEINGKGRRKKEMGYSRHWKCRFCLRRHFHNHNQTREVDHSGLINRLFLPLLLERNQSISKDIMLNQR
jgi:hypothetical protein